MCRNNPPKQVEQVPVTFHCAEMKRFYEENKQGRDDFKFTEMIEELKDNREIKG